MSGTYKNASFVIRDPSREVVEKIHLWAVELQIEKLKEKCLNPDIRIMYHKNCYIVFTRKHDKFVKSEIDDPKIAFNEAYNDTVNNFSAKI